MREVHRTATTIVFAVDDPDSKAGGACHQYMVTDLDGSELQRLSFQHGPVLEAGVNGVQHVDLLAIILDRHDCFQRGPFASSINDVTCGFVEAAMASEGTRTRRRSLAGVEGQSQKAPGVER